MSPISEPASPLPTPLSAFLAGLRASFLSVFTLVLLGTYVGIGALAHDYGFTLPWVLVSTVLLWAGPTQVILISALGTGATLFETAVAVGLSAVRFLPMVVALLPLMRSPQTRTRELLLPAHLTAASMWVESFRLLAGGAAGAADRLLQRARARFHAVRPCRHIHRLLSDGGAAGIAHGGACCS